MYIAGGVVTVEQTTISGNTAGYVSASSLPSFLIHCPHGKSADVSASRVTCFGDGGVLVASECECLPFELSATFSPLPPWEVTHTTDMFVLSTLRLHRKYAWQRPRTPSIAPLDALFF